MPPRRSLWASLTARRKEALTASPSGVNNRAGTLHVSGATFLLWPFPGRRRPVGAAQGAREEEAAQVRARWWGWPGWVSLAPFFG